VTNLLRSSEIKCYDYTFTNTNNFLLPTFITAIGSDAGFVVDTDGSGSGFSCINEIIQGVTDVTRIGDKIVILSVQLKLTLRLVGTDGFNTARVVLVHDKFPNGAYPGISDIFLSHGTANTLTFGSRLNRLNNDRFQLLGEKVIDLDVDNLNDYTVNINKRNLSILTQYRATAGAIADVSQGGIYLIAGSQVYAGAAGATTSINPILVEVRIRYLDH